MRRIIFCIMISVFLISCGGDESSIESRYNIIGIWEVSPTLNCEEYDCYYNTCKNAKAPSKYSLTIKKSDDDLVVLFHDGGDVYGPYELKHKINNNYNIIYYNVDNDDFTEKYEFSITFNSDKLFTGSESWLFIDSIGYCEEVYSLIGEKII